MDHFQKGVDERVESPDGSTVAVERVEESKLSFPFSAKAVILEGITDSTLLLLPTETSVLVQKCSRMKLVAAAQQIRIHDSRDLTLYVHFGSAVIIGDYSCLQITALTFIGSEGCTGIKLAPYLLSTSQEHLAKDPLGRYFTADARSRCATGMLMCLCFVRSPTTTTLVMDFDCVTGKSPNWSLLGEGEFEEFTL